MSSSRTKKKKHSSSSSSRKGTTPTPTSSSTTSSSSSNNHVGAAGVDLLVGAMGRTSSSGSGKETVLAALSASSDPPQPPASSTATSLRLQRDFAKLFAPALEPSPATVPQFSSVRQRIPNSVLLSTSTGLAALPPDDSLPFFLLDWARRGQREMLAMVIKASKPLPKGHGPIIDSTTPGRETHGMGATALHLA